MITTIFIISLLTVLLAVLSFLPAASTLPFGIDGALYTVGRWIAEITQYVWPLDIVFTIFFKVYLPFLIVLLVLKFILGHRAPGRDIS